MKKNYYTGTKGGIELEPGSKFEFVYCLNVYKSYQLGPSKDPGRPFLCNGPSKVIALQKWKLNILTILLI